MLPNSNAELVTVFGGSGFLGSQIVAALARRGYRVRVACRRPDLAGHLQPLGGVGQIHAVQANLRYRWSVDRAVEGADHVINCVGILFETGGQKFDAVQSFGARAIAEATRAVGATLTHISAIGADKDSDVAYQRTKGEAEAAIHDILPDAIILRPSIIFGADDNFFNQFANMARFSPALPLIGGGETKFQPVFVEDVAKAVAKAVDGDLPKGAIFELGGPEVMSFKDIMQSVLDVTGRKRLLAPIPFWLAKIQGSVMGILPKPMLTRDQVVMLESDNVVTDQAKAEGKTLESMGIEPTSTAAILPSYLWRYRPEGQFSETVG